ncbi:hypothetical protein [Actinoplanes sp. NPDC051859]|uniref:helix-turn-helix domain-containing protein n=1 Tax=Actinoplanes sp. NPDC051859 TaxID=3363909 RepID=UPI00378F0872
MTGETQTGLSTTDISDELARHVKAWRQRLDPNIFPDHHTGARRRQRVSQELAAVRIGCSLAWYRSLERGEIHNWSSDLLNRVAITLHLNADERVLLFLLATGNEPQPSADAAPIANGLESLITTLRSQPWPAYLNDEAWDLIAYNQHMADWFPWVTGGESNIMRWVFTYPEAKQQLHRWETDWAPQMLAQIRFVHARLPEHPRLKVIIDEIRAKCAFARDRWDDTSTYQHPDGDRRSLFLPYHQREKPVNIVALQPLRAPNHRLIYVVPAS